MNPRHHLTQIVLAITLAAPALITNNATASNGPTGFTENKGQIHDQFRKPNPSVLYLMNGNGMNVQLRNTGFAYDTYTMEEGEGNLDVRDTAHGFDAMGRTTPEPIPTTFRFHRIELHFVNGNPEPEILRAGESEDYTNYYTDVTGEAGATFVRSYSTITYRNVWPNIDVRFNAGEKGFKYDVIVRPGGAISDVRFAAEGATISEDLKGRLVFTWADGTLEEQIPESWVENGRRKSTAEARYDVGTDATFGFGIHGSVEGTLVIDPSPIIWATYYGGTLTENGCATALDGNNNAYLCGTTISSTNIATAGSHDATYNMAYDGFVAKFTEAGVRLWGTYFGGSSDDQPTDMAANNVGTFVVVGTTSSTAGIATAGTHQSAAVDNADGFAIVFNTSGLRQWGTYYAGTGSFPNQDYANCVALATDGRVAMAGWSTAANGITTPGTENPNGGYGFLTVLSNTGQRNWGTRVGNADELLWGVTFIGTNRVAVAGQTSSTTGIATSTPGRHDGTHNGNWDSFLINYNASTGLRVWGTYFGGSGLDVATDLAYVGLSRIAICGHTTSTAGMATSGAHQTAYAGGTSDGFVAVFNTSSGARFWSSYYGTALNDQLTSLDGTESDHIAIGCIKNATTLGSVGQSSALDFSNSGTLYYAPVLASNANKCAVSANPHGMMVAGTTSATNVATWGAFQTTLAGGFDAFLYHLHYSLVPLGMALENNNDNTSALMKVVVSDRHLRFDASPNIDGADQPTNVTIHDAMGRVVLRWSVSGIGVSTTDLNALSPGAYVLTLQGSSGFHQAERFLLP